jgi:hypothetical protein
MLDDWYAFMELRHYQSAVYQVDVLLDSEGLLLVLFLEAWEALLPFLLFLAPAEEMVVSVLQALDRILQGLATYFIEPSVGRLEFW